MSFSYISRVPWSSSILAIQSILSTLVLFSSFCPLESCLVHSVFPVHFGFIRSIWSYSVHVGHIWSTLVLFGLLWSYSVHSVQFCSSQSNLILFGPHWSYSVHFGLIRSNSVHSVNFSLFGLIRSILLTLVLFGLIWSTLILFSPLKLKLLIFIYFLSHGNME